MWLETVLLIEAAVAFWLSVLNVLLLLLGVIFPARTRARRIAATVLASVCAAQAMEALLFLWLGETSATDAWPNVALLVVRTSLLASIALISLLLARGLSLRR